MNSGALLCATLRRPPGRPDPALAAAWSDPPRALLPLVRHEEAALWLSRRLTERGIKEALPEELRRALRNEVLVAAGTALRIEAEARTVLGLLAEAGIPVIPLKGTARRILAARWPILAARPLGDVDLLVQPTRASDAWELLRSEGFEPAMPEAGAKYDSHHHLPGLVGAGKVSIELHRSPLSALPRDEGWHRYWDTSELVSWQGLEVRLPGPTELAWHAISHAVTDGVAGFRLRQLLDLVGLVQSGAAIDWAVIDSRVGNEVVIDALTMTRAPFRPIRQWLGAAMALLEPGEAAPMHRIALPVDLPALLDGRAHLLGSRLGRNRRLRGRLLVEWTRSRLGWPLEPTDDTLWRRARGRAAGWMARCTGRLLIGTRVGSRANL